jgi:thioredoxin-like negative regulator of GroEL
MEFYYPGILENPHNIVLMFGGENCSACKTLKSKLEDIILLFTGVSFWYVDVEKHERESKFYEISSLPTLVFLKGGRKVFEMKGAILRPKLIEELSRIFK